MNKAFKVVWNSVRKQFVVVNEVQTTRSKSKSISLKLTQVSLAVLAMLVASESYAALEGNATDGFYINNTQSGVTDYSNDQNITDGLLAWTQYALTTSGEGVTTYYFRPQLTLKADSYVVSSKNGVTYLGIDRYQSSVASVILIENLSNKPKSTVYGIRTTSAGQSYLEARNEIGISVRNTGISYGIYTVDIKSSASVTADSESGSISVFAWQPKTDNDSEIRPSTSYGVFLTSAEGSNTLSGNRIDISAGASQYAYAIYSSSGKQSFTSSALTVSATTNASYYKGNEFGAYALRGLKNSNTYISKAKSVVLSSSVTAEKTGTTACGIYLNGTSHVYINSSEEDNPAEKVEITSSGGSYSKAVHVASNSTLDIASQNIILDASSSQSDAEVYGALSDLSEVTLQGDSISITANSENNQAIAVKAVTKKDNDSSVANVTIGDDTTSSVYISAKGKGGAKEANGVTSGYFVLGLNAHYNNSNVTVKAKNITVEATGYDGADTSYISGVLSQNNTKDAKYTGDAATINLISNDADGLIKINSDGLGISAFSNGIVNVTGNLDLEAQVNAIDTRGYASININTTNSSYTTKLQGDIVFEGNADETIDAYVNIALNGSDSYWKGRSYTEIGGKEVLTSYFDPDTGYNGQVKGFNLRISNGARWNATGNSFVNELTLNGGNISLKEGSALYTGEFTVNGSNNTLTLGKNASISGSIFLTEGSKLSADLYSAYKNIDETNGIVDGGEANLPLLGSGTLLITDSFTYTVNGLTKLTEEYTKNNSISVIFEKATLYVDPTVKFIPIAKGATLKLLAKGADKDVASGATLNIEGAVHVINDGATTEAKLGTAQIQEGGSLQVETKVVAEEITLIKGSQLNIGNEYTSGKLTAKKLTIAEGSKVFLDPTWENGQESSVAAFNLAENKLDGQLVVGQNSKAEIGSTDTAELEAALKTIGKTVSENGIKAIAYINKAVELGASGALVVDGDLTEAPNDTTGVNVAEKSALVVNAAAGADGAAIITGSTGSFIVAGTLYLDNVTADQSITVATGFKDVTVADVQAVNRLLTVTADIADGTIKLGTATNSALISSTIASNTLNAAVAGATGTGADRIAALFDATNGTSDTAAAKSIDSIALMGTASAAQAVAINAANMIADGLEQHGSVLASYAHDKTGADLWIDLNGSFSKAGRYQAATTTYGYKSDLAGATIGADYAFGNGAAVGGAFSFGTGSARGQGNGAGIKNDIEYYGFNIYGAYSTPYVNLIGTVGYTLSKNEISQQGYKGKPDVNTFSVGIRAEKDFKVTDSFAITPHVGIRYLNVDMDNFTAGGFKYTAKKVNITEVPVGVAFNANLKAPCGADVKPFADFTIAPAMGSKKASNKFGLVGSAATDTIRSRVANSNLYQGKIGVNATQGNHSLSFSYGIGAGSDSRVDQALQAKYRYSF